jgi:hypothetical protein
MKNRISFFVALILMAFSIHAQSLPLTIEGSSGKFYLVHTVVAKENWYSIGRLFNQGPHEIASFNNMNFDKPLEVGTILNIPLTPVNFDQKDLKLAGETLVPIYHVVGEKEWIFKISSTYNDVPVTSLEKWNKVKRDDVKKGTSLIIGFLKVKTDQSPLALGISVNPANKDAVAQSNPPVNSTPNNTKKEVTTVPNTNSTTSNNNTKKEVTTVPNTNSTTTNIIPVSNPSDHVNNYATTHSNGGFFSADFTAVGKSASGVAGTFKSTSGWSDGKYYALMNGIPVGTIIRVSGTNGKTIYAKVLGQLPEMKESSGLIIRISNAASAELGLGEGKFPVEVKY